MPLYRITLAYDGTDYQGWQVQPEADTIQGRLESALSRMTGHPVEVVGAGRTDAGVHAHAQVAHFHLDRPIPPAGLLRGMNSILPRDIRILEASPAPAGFHARRWVKSKTYRYYLDPRRVPSPFRARFAQHYPFPLDREAMEGAAALFLGQRDFAAFAASSSRVRSTARALTCSRLFEQEGELVYEVTASGFLHHMARNLVGTLLEAGRGRLRPGEIEALFEGKDRRLAGPTAPARGLHLIGVAYPPDEKDEKG